MIYFCAQKSRRDLVLTRSPLNGIDYAELPGERPGCGTQLAITFLKDARGLALGVNNVSVSGGTAITVTGVDAASDADPLVVVVTFSGTGDFSPYTLTLVATPGGNDAPAGLDPALSSITFSFKADCPSPADCLATTCCATPAAPPPDINYLAKDYPGFVQVMLDRMAALMPAWSETHAADMGVALVEALAYAADHLSYQQDAVSTEAYLGTARSRISLRRHARLVDYAIGEGCNARAWIFLNTTKDDQPVPAGTAFYVRTPGEPTVVRPTDLPHVAALQAGTQPVFSSLCDVTLQTEQNSLSFYTWSDTDCCLPAGATQATLSGHCATLNTGTVLMFEEVLGPLTGAAADADPTHRWAVRLTSVRLFDDGGATLADPLTGEAITEITWAAQDAPPFPLCLSVTLTNDDGTPAPIADVSLARGNLVPADHGVAVTGEALGVVPKLPLAAQAATGCTCDDGTGTAVALTAHARFYPELAQTLLTFAPPYDATAPASAFQSAGPDAAVPQITVSSDDARRWSAVPDLLESPAEAAAFVPEIEADGSVHLRFGDGQYGAAPAPGLQFTASYRVGNGSAGNVGRDSIVHMIWNPQFITIVRNPLAAAGGVDAESMETIRQYAPFSFQTQARCVTEDDYGAQASTFPGISEARGTLRWTGSWYSAFVSIEPDTTLTPQLAADTRRRLDLLRMLGVDVAAEAARIVGLAIVLRICVAPDHFRGDVYSALLRRFITGDQCDGQPGLLNAANFVFGQTIYASPLVAAAQAVDGVISATLAQFGRLDAPWVDGVAQGYLTLGRLEIARCDNDPNHLDRGTFTLLLDGGK
ncbi:Baseplate_J domain-containing protein [Paraburkholderia unamae]|uniref:baseplate J/gp47 family protein n=1 Tax=Paraburkholderia unamae TaxID=219649 RepID=UPI001CAFC6C3|nr:baseplate J/gp47 family protein [Paraburkholderia unamae]CAG9244910.1 Baseplate_J domain-containing protein [Paraburkholderia unamae]